MSIKTVMCALLSVAVLAGCQQQPGQDIMGNPTNNGGISKKSVGTIGGAVVGGVLGSKVGGGTGNAIAIGLGTLLGAGLGSSIGESLDRADMQYYHQTSQQAMEVGQPGQAFPWQNPQSGNSGTVTPSNYYQNSAGQYCREYAQTINVGGSAQSGYGTACRQPDGTWQIVQ